MEIPSQFPGVLGEDNIDFVSAEDLAFTDQDAMDLFELSWHSIGKEEAYSIIERMCGWPIAVGALTGGGHVPETATIHYQPPADFRLTPRICDEH